ncbi:MAG: hypothetical protein ACPL1A_09675 [Candidatus Kapaibacteriota bacterium]
MVILKQKYSKVSLIFILLLSLILSQLASNYHHHTKKEVCSVGCSCNVTFNQSNENRAFHNVVITEKSINNDECFVCKSLELFQHYAKIIEFDNPTLVFSIVKIVFFQSEFHGQIQEIKSNRGPPIF